MSQLDSLHEAAEPESSQHEAPVDGRQLSHRRTVIRLGAFGIAIGLLQPGCRGEQMSKELELWDRGGPPGRGYEQNLLSITPDGSRWKARYTKVRWDEKNPPYGSEEYEVALAPADGATLIELAERAFDRSYDEESDQTVADGTKLTLTIRERGREREKTFFVGWPKDLAELDERLDALMRRAEQQATSR
jgi:hypothetical protein